MKPVLHTVIAVLCMAAMFVSCKSSGPKEARYIPKDASMVLVVDPGALQDKLQKGGISVDTLLARVFKTDSTDDKDKEKLNDFRTNAGIDWNSQLYFFMLQKGSKTGGQVNIFNVMGGLSDAAKLEAFLKKQDKAKGKEIKKEKDYAYLMDKDGSMVAWTDKHVIVTVYHLTRKPSFDTVTMTFQQQAPVNVEAELKKQVDAYFTQKKEESMAGVEAFTAMFKEKADGYAFTGSNSSLAALSMMPFQLPKMEELLKDNYTAATLTFEDGKILAKSTSYPNHLLSGVLKEYPGPTVNLSLIERYPSEHINGIMLTAFNPEIVGGILKQLEVEGLVNGFMEKSGFTSQDLYKSLKGDIALIVSDLGMLQSEPQARQDEKTLIRKKPVGKMIFNATIGNKVSFTKLMDKAAEQGFVVKQGATYKSGGLLSAFGIFVMANDKNLILASDSATYVQYMSNTAKASINNDALSRFKGKSTVLYFDIANTIAGFMNDDGTGNYDRSLNTAKETFKDIIVTSDNFNGKSINAICEVRMQNEKQNSLVTLTSLLTDIAVDMRVAARREKEIEDKLFPGGVPAIIRTN